jgi:hypothetical protein
LLLAWAAAHQRSQREQERQVDEWFEVLGRIHTKYFTDYFKLGGLNIPSQDHQTVHLILYLDNSYIIVTAQAQSS